MADTTDQPDGDAEGGEEEDPPEVDPLEEGEGMKILVERMKVHVNQALAQELWYEASQIQQGIMIVLNASSGSAPEGMSMNVVQNLRGVFQRLYRYSRNRGGGTLTEVYQQYIDDVYHMMRPHPIRG